MLDVEVAAGLTRRNCAQSLRRDRLRSWYRRTSLRGQCKTATLRGRALAGYDPSVVESATYAVTLEPAGGSPTGAPTSAPLWTGKLVQATP